VVSVAATKVWLLAAKAVPLHHLVALVSSIATSVLATVVEAAEETVPVIVPVQSDP
jgi:hypothetical protein